MLKRRDFLRAGIVALPAARVSHSAEYGNAGHIPGLAEALKIAAKAPPLPKPSGKVIRVSDVPSLRETVAGAEPGTTILLAEGRYQIDELLVTQDRLSIRGESGNRNGVILDGQGKFTKIVRIRGAKDLVIADLTVANSRQYGIFFLGDSDVQRLLVYNVKFHNCYTRGLKGTHAERINDSSTNRYPLEQARKIRPAAGQVRYCLFVNDEVNPNLQPFNGDYIGGIDMMWAKDWTIAGNLFINILGQRGGGRGAIFVWVNSENVVAERNLIVNCDRGICFGNPSGGPVHMIGGVIRNNFIVAGRSQAIEICQARDTAVLNNTVFGANLAQHTIEAHKTGPGNRCINNLVCGVLDVSTEVTAENNVTNPPENWFANPRAGDLHLTREAKGALSRGKRLDEVLDDFDGEKRTDPPDIGADQHGSPDRS